MKEISLRNKYGEIIFDTLKDTDEFKWEYNNKYISNKNNGFIGVKDDKIVLIDEKLFEWELIDKNYLFNKNSGLYLSCNLDYQLELNSHKKNAIPIYFSEEGIHYTKSKIRLDFDANNLMYNIKNLKNIVPCQITFGSKNIGLLLIGGFGTRFDNNICKQLYKIDSIPLFFYSLEILVKTLDYVVIVVNSIFYNEVKEIISSLNKKKHIFVITNDVGDRLESIFAGLDFIDKNFSKDIVNIIIHDGSRPFIKEKHINNLLSVMKEDDIFYSQYYLNLTNGLLKCNNDNYEEVNRDDFIEICTPVCVNFGLFFFLFLNYIKKERRICWEIIPLLDLLKIKYKMIKGSIKSLQKITTKDDLEDVV